MGQEKYKQCLEQATTSVMLYLGDRQWHKGKEIEEAIGVTTAQLRKIANQTGLLITSNQKGYILGCFATEEEFIECIEQLESRIIGLKYHIKMLEEYNIKWKQSESSC